MALPSTRILVIEDEASHAEAILRSLEAMDGAELRVMTTLREFREHGANWNPDIALMDLNLPDGQAIEILADPEDSRPFAVVVMTSFGSEEVAVEALKSGAFDYLVKSPETFNGLPRTLERLLREWQLRSETKRTQRALKESEARLHFALQTSSIGAWDLDLHDHTAHRTLLHDQIFGYEEKLPLWTYEMFLEHVLPEDREEVNRKVQEAIAARSNLNFECRICRQDGVTRWIWAAAGHQENAGGPPIRISGIVQDITERKQAEDALRESETQFRTLAALAPVGIYITDSGGNCLFVNPAWCKMAGLSPQEALGHGWMNGLHPDDRDLIFSSWTHMVESKGEWGLEYRFRTQEGKVTLVYGMATPQFDPLGKVIRYVGVNLDITELKQAEEERRKLEERTNLVQKLEALGVLVAGVAHNMNNVLAAIMGTASLREQQATTLLDLEAYKIIGTACRRGRDVVKSLMHFAQPSLSNKVPIELHVLLTELRVLLENTTHNRIEIVEAYYEEPLWIRGDGGTLSSAFMNLCLNAMDAMPKGGTLTLRTAIPEADWIEVSVEDTGEGMSPEIQARALEPFFTTKEVGKGTGLGLSMTHGVIKAHHGTLEIFSQVAEGTTIVLRFPRISPPAAKNTSIASPPSPGSLNVLVVDDDEDVRFLVVRMLRASGHRAQAVSSGEEALESLRSSPAPDLIILDQNMPGMDGTQTMEQIRTQHLDMPILISSGQPDIEHWPIFNQPRVAVIAKPFTLDEILAKLSQFGPAHPC